MFLTGHTGFKGTWLSVWLHMLGAKVSGYALEPNTEPSLFGLIKSEELLQSVIGDVRDSVSLKRAISQFKPDIVFHLAAQPLVRESYRLPEETFSTNVMGTVNVLEAVRHCSSIKAFINVTTDKVYENQEQLNGYREDDKLGGYDPYSNSKVCSELVTSSYLNSFFNPNDYEKHGVAIATVRAGNVIGGGDWAADRIIPDIVRAIKTDEQLIIRNPDAIRPWQHVLEPLSGYLRLAEKLYAEGVGWNGAWNFGPVLENTKKVTDLINKFQECYGQPVLVHYEKDTAMHETGILTLDTSKARTLLNWRTGMNFDDIVNLTAAWYKQYKVVDPLQLCRQQIKHFMKEKWHEEGCCDRS